MAARRIQVALSVPSAGRRPTEFPGTFQPRSLVLDGRHVVLLARTTGSLKWDLPREPCKGSV